MADADGCASGLPRNEEIRFAVVLNGGVSLAVWMGGVANEINELTRESGPYGRLMECLGVSARADVIAGTSAGGINGAALALGQVNSRADLVVLRDLWADQGSMEALLQAPFTGRPTSLLRGDAYFLPQLHEAMMRLTKPWADPSPKGSRPVDLTITTTLLNGAYSLTTDSVGQILPQLRHDGQFRFVRGIDEREIEQDHFAQHSEVAAALALAARCSAGFPVAFEPSFVPVNLPQRPTGADASWEFRPDMARYANWLTYGPATVRAGDHSRFAVDGGVLANTPTRQALAAIQRMPASRQVQRVMLLVYPHAPATYDLRPDEPTLPPTAVGTLSHLLQTLMREGSRTFVNEVEEHNRRAATRQGVRTDIVRRYQADLDGLHEKAECAAELYRIVRRRRTARDFAARVELPTTMTFDQVREAADLAQVLWQEERGYLPYLPANLVNASERFDDATWAWGTTSALDIADIALRFVDAVQRRDPGRTNDLTFLRSRIHEQASTLRKIRDVLDSQIDDQFLSTEVQPDRGYWTRRLDFYAWAMNADAEARERLAGALASSLPGSGQDRPPVLDRLEELSSAGENTARAVASIVEALSQVTLDNSRAQLPATPSDVAWSALLSAHQAVHAGDRRQLLSLLMDLHIVSWTVGDEYPTENTTPVDLVQISAQTDHAFARYSKQLHGKLGGASIARFSGFLKRSWRVNDWTWGRLDAATLLTRILLSPERLRRLDSQLDEPGTTREAPARDVVDHLLRQVYAVEEGQSSEEWAQAHPWAVELRKDAIAEVQAALSSEYPSPSAGANQREYALQNLTELLTYARYTDVILNELPQIASAIVADRFDGANPRSRGERFLEQYGELITAVERQNLDRSATPEARLDLGARALTAFDAAGIGREPLEQERSSDQMIRTAVTAASVGAAVMDSPGAGLGRFNPVTRTLRGAMRLPYWVATGLTSAGAIAGFLALVALGAGGVLLALSLLGVLHGSFASIAAMIGGGAVLFAFGYAALRTGSLLHGLVLLSAAIPLAVVGLHRAGENGAQGFGAATVTVAVVIGLLILGTLPTPLSSPAMTIVRTGRRGRSRIRVGIRRFNATWLHKPSELMARVARNLFVIAILLVVVYEGRRVTDGGLTWHEAERDLWVCVAVAAAAGLMCAWIGGALLGTWRWKQGIPAPVSSLRRIVQWLDNLSLGVVKRPRGSTTAGVIGEWVGVSVSLPMGVTVGWAWVYGALYAVLAYVLKRVNGRHLDAWIVSVQLAAIILFLLVPALLPLVARKRIAASVLKRARSGSYRLPDRDHLDNVVDQAKLPNLTAWLVAHELTYRYLLSPKGSQLRLRTAGRTLEERVRVELNARERLIQQGLAR